MRKTWWIVAAVGVALTVVGYLTANRLPYVAGAIVLAVGLAVAVGRRWLGALLGLVALAAIVGIPSLALRSHGSDVLWSADLDASPDAVLATDTAIVTMADDTVRTFELDTGLDRSTMLPGRVEFLSDAGDGLVVAQTSTAVTVLRVPDLEIVWQTQRTDDTTRVQPLAADQGVVAFGAWAADGTGAPDRVFGVDDTGTQVWEQTLTGYDLLTMRIPFEDTTSVLPSVVVGSVAGPGTPLRTLDARSGDVLDERTERPVAATGDAVLWIPDDADSDTCPGTVTRRGEETWTEEIPCPAGDFGPTVLADRVVYEREDGRSVTVDLESGDVVEVPTNHRSNDSAGEVGDAEFVVQVADPQGVLRATAIADGAALWTFDGRGPGPLSDFGPHTTLRADTAAVRSDILDRNPMASPSWQEDGDQLSVLDATTGEVTGVVRAWDVGTVTPLSGARAAAVVTDEPNDDATHFRLVLVGRAS